MAHFFKKIHLIQSGSYFWTDGTPYDGLNLWNEDEPNDPENEKCVEILNDNGKWNDIPCSYSQHVYVCKAPRRKSYLGCSTLRRCKSRLLVCPG